MPYAGLGINRLPPFGDQIDFTFDRRVNVFIGPNGTGKSTILKVLSTNFPPSAIPGWHDEARVAGVSSSEWPFAPDGSPDNDAIPQIFIPPVRLVMPQSTDEYKVLQFGIGDENFDWATLLSEFPYSFFDGARVYDAMQKLFNEDLHSVPRNIRGVKLSLIVHQCVKSICSEIVVGSAPRNITTEEFLSNDSDTDDIPPDLLKQTATHYAMGVQTDEGTDRPLYIGDLSTGTQGTFLWVWYLALRMAHLYDFEDGWQDRPAVLMIDEIENHLHPTWQRRVIPALLQHFPKLQIFATTHSPFVVAGLQTGQVHKLYRDEMGNLQSMPNPEPIVGWTVEEILREFMATTDPTDDYTARAAAVLRWLRYQEPAAGDAQEWKTLKIAELKKIARRHPDQSASLHWLKCQPELQGDAPLWWREQIEALELHVSLDLESHGPIAAQNALFLRQLSELLEADDGELDEQEN